MTAREATILLVDDLVERLRGQLVEVEIAVRNATLSDGSANVSPWGEANASAGELRASAGALAKTCRWLRDHPRPISILTKVIRNDAQEPA